MKNKVNGKDNKHPDEAMKTRANHGFLVTTPIFTLRLVGSHGG